MSRPNLYDRQGGEDASENNIRSIKMALSALSFWCAIVLSVIYLPLLILGNGSSTTVMIFLAIISVHVVALIGGRPYCRAME